MSTLAERRLQMSQLGVATNTTRPNSCYLRELSCGNFIIKCEQITQLENLGQGMYVYCVRGPGRGIQITCILTQ